jgi:hypothetical protein
METNTDEKSTAISLRPLRFPRASYLLPLALNARPGRCSRLVCSDLIAHAYQRGRSHIRVADDTFTITLRAQSSNGNAGLLATHNQIWVMLRHGCCCGSKLRGGSEAAAALEVRVKATPETTNWAT